MSLALPTEVFQTNVIKKIALVFDNIMVNVYGCQSYDMEFTEEPAKQVKSQKSTFFKLKFQTAETITSILAGVRKR